MSGCPCHDPANGPPSPGTCAAEQAAAKALGRDPMSVEPGVLEGAGGGQVVTLASLKPGQTGVVRGATLDAGDAAYLRAMGVRPAALVRVCRLGHPCIIQVVSGGKECCGMGSCRIGLSKELAERVMVEVGAG
jgi:Fe2+ transport system protein FeoA